MTPETALKTLDYVEASGTALHAAQLLAEKTAATQAAVAREIPSRVAHLLKAGHIVEGEKTAAANLLSTHEGSLDMVNNLLVMLDEQKQAYEQKLAAAGNGHSVKAASTNGDRRNNGDATLDYSMGGFVGRRQGMGEKSAADMAMIRSLGLEGRIGQR
jgi:hypothetical protein